MRPARSSASFWIPVFLVVPMLLTVTGHTVADADVIPGSEFDHQNGWYAMRLDAPAGGFFAEVRVDDLWRDSQIRGATMVSVLDASGEEVGWFTFVGDDGGLTASAHVGGVTVAPELPQIFENEFSQQIYFLLYFPVEGEHTLVFTGGAEGGFTGAVMMFVQPEHIIAESSGTEAYFVTEADLQCLAGASGVVPTQEADGAWFGAMALVGCSWALEATSGFAGLVHIHDRVAPETTEFGVRAPSGERIAPEQEDLRIVAATPGAWAIEVDRHLGHGEDGAWSGVAAVVADVAMP